MKAPSHRLVRFDSFCLAALRRYAVQVYRLHVMYVVEVMVVVVVVVAFVVGRRKDHPYSLLLLHLSTAVLHYASPAAKRYLCWPVWPTRGFQTYPCALT